MAARVAVRTRTPICGPARDAVGSRGSPRLRPRGEGFHEPYTPRRYSKVRSTQEIHVGTRRWIGRRRVLCAAGFTFLARGCAPVAEPAPAPPEPTVVGGL